MRVNDALLVDHSADDTEPRSISCHFVEVHDPLSMPVIFIALGAERHATGFSFAVGARSADLVQLLRKHVVWRALNRHHPHPFDALCTSAG
ncbi:MAG TPA: hypothetical protein VGJ20_33080 [Xanthobacteraceae bacterium]